MGLIIKTVYQLVQVVTATEKFAISRDCCQARARFIDIRSMAPPALRGFHWPGDLVTSRLVTCRRRRRSLFEKEKSYNGRLPVRAEAHRSWLNTAEAITSDLLTKHKNYLSCLSGLCQTSCRVQHSCLVTIYYKGH